jgi:hypothetical protein
LQGLEYHWLCGLASVTLRTAVIYIFTPLGFNILKQYKLLSTSVRRYPFVFHTFKSEKNFPQNKWRFIKKLLFIHRIT